MQSSICPARHRRGLFAVLRKAFTLWKTIPVLQIFADRDFKLLPRRIPDAQIQEHLRSDRVFTDELVARCLVAGIPIWADPARIDDLLHAAFFTSLHEDDLGPGRLAGAVDLLLELVAAFCLGEVEILGHDPTSEYSYEAND